MGRGREINRGEERDDLLLLGVGARSASDSDKALLGGIGSLLSGFQRQLDGSVLAQVVVGLLLLKNTFNSCSTPLATYSFLELFLLELQLGGELLNELRELVVVLLVLSNLELELADLAVSTSEGLGGFSSTAGLGLQVGLQSLQALFGLLDGLGSSLHDGSLGSVGTLLKILKRVKYENEITQLVRLNTTNLDGALELLLESLELLGLLLLVAEVLSKLGGIAGGTATTVLGSGEFSVGLGDIALKKGDLVVELALGGGEGDVLGVELVVVLLVLLHRAFDDTASALDLKSVLKLDDELFLLLLGNSELSLGGQQVLTELLTTLLLLIHASWALLLPDVLLRIFVRFVRMVESDLQLVDIGLQLLLDAEQLRLGLGLRVQSGLDTVDGLLVDLAVVLELLLLLGNSLLNLGTDLRDLDLAAESLALLRLKGSLSLVQSTLKLLLLHFETTKVLGKGVGGTSSLRELLGEIAGFVAERFVLTTESLDLIGQGIVLSTELVGLSGELASIALSSVQLEVEVVDLLLPLIDDLVEGLLLLLQGGNSLSVMLSLEAVGIGFSGIKGILDLGSLLVLTLLDLIELIGSDKSFGLELGSPLIELDGSLGELAGSLVLSSDLVFDGLLELFELAGQVLGQVGEVLTLAGLLLGGSLGVVQFVGELELETVGSLDLGLQLFDLAGQIGVLGVETSLGGDKVLELAGLFVSLEAELEESDFVSLGDSLLVSTEFGFLVKSGGGLIELALHVSLLLLDSSLLLLELLDLIGELLDSIGSLLLENSELLSELESALLEVTADLGELSILLLSEFNLSGGGTGLILELLGELIVLSLLLGSGAVSTLAGVLLVGELIMEILDSGLILLDSLLELGNSGLLVLELHSQVVQLGLLASESVLSIALSLVELFQGFLGNLELSLGLSLVLVHISAVSLFTLHGLLGVLKGLHELGLELVGSQVLLLSGLEILSELLVLLFLVLSLLVELGDVLILLSHFILESADLVLLGVLLSFNLSQRKINVLAVLLELSAFSLDKLLLLVDLKSTSLFGFKLLVGIGELALESNLLLVHSGHTLLNFTGASLASLQLRQEISRLLVETFSTLLELAFLLLLLHQRVLEGRDGLLKLLVLSLDLSRVNEWLDLSVELEPDPGLYYVEVTHDLEVPFGLSLKSSDELSKFGVTQVFQVGDDSGLEEDLGETNSEVVLFKLLLLHQTGKHGSGSLLGIGLSGESLIGSEQSVTLDKVWVKSSVGESLAANSDSFQHSVAGELVEHKTSVDDSGSLLLVGDDTTDEVRVGGVEHSHQLVEGLSVEHRDSHERSRLSLLLSTSSRLGGNSGLLLGGVVLPDLDDESILLGSLHDGDDGVVEGVLVLLEPVHDVVTDSSGVVPHGEVSLGLLSLWWLWLLEVRVLAQVLVDELLGEGQVSSLWHNALLIEHSNDTKWLLNKLDTGLQVKTEINEDPLDSFTSVLFLLKDEHVMVEELLEFLIDEVDPKLLEGVEVEDFESGDIEHSDEVVTGDSLLVKSLVTLLDEPVEDSGVETLGHGSDGPVDLLDVLSLVDPFVSDLDTWTSQSLQELLGVDSEALGGSLGIWN